METAAAHAQLFKIAVRQAVQIRLRRHGLVEAGIKYRHLLHAGEQALGGPRRSGWQQRRQRAMAATS